MKKPLILLIKTKILWNLKQLLLTLMFPKFQSLVQLCGHSPAWPRPCLKRLAAKGVNIQVISTSEIKISVLIDAEYTELAVRSLHTAFGLDDG